MPSALPIESRRPRSGHEPVLADEVVRMLALRPGETVVDCTFGAGGHARRLAPVLGEAGRYIAIDQDPEAAGWFADLADDVVCETRFIRANFAEALPRLVDQGLRADAVLMDLGLSSMQVDQTQRGFSYSRQAPLDMRMDPSQERSAADLVAELGERELTDIMRTYGEERYARPIARAIVRRRDAHPILTTGDLVEVVRSAVPTPALFAGGHPAKRVFQALRIAVNDELGSLERGLEAALRAAGARRAPRRDLVPLARGPDGQALHAGAQPGLHLPAGDAGLRMRPRRRGRAAGRQGPASPPGRARPQPARPLGPAARRAPGGSGVSTRATARTAAPAQAPARPRTRPAAAPEPRRRRPAAARPRPRAVPLAARLRNPRLLIPLIALILGGIVFVNVAKLSLTNQTGQVIERARSIESETARLKATLEAKNASVRLNAQRRLGMVEPAPGAVGYLDPRPAPATAP